MSRLLYLIAGLGSGGSERQLLYLTRALRDEGHDVTVAVWNFRRDDVYVEPVLGTGALLVPLTGGLFTRIRQIRRLIHERRVEVVHSETFYLNPIVALAAAGTSASAVGSVRSSLETGMKLAGVVRGRIAACWPRRQIFNNRAALAEARSKLLFRPRRLALFENHVDVDAFPDVDLPLRPHAVALGSLLPYKRYDRLLRACARLRDARIDFHLTIAGEGPLREELQSEIERLGLRDLVTLRGYVEDVKALLSEAWFLVHPSETEGAPNAVLEAAAGGRAVIATAVGDVPWLVRDGETGYVVADGDDAALFERMAALLSDRDACVRMGRRARDLTRERSGNGSRAARILEVYRMLGCH